MRPIAWTRIAVTVATISVIAAACASDTSEPSAAPTSAVPLEDQELVVSNWAAYTPEGLVEDFEKETGVEVTLLEDHVNNEDMVGKLQATDGVGRDVVFISGPYVKTLLDNGWVTEIDHSQIPNLANLYPEATELAYDPGNVLLGALHLGHDGHVLPNRPRRRRDRCGRTC